MSDIQKMICSGLFLRIRKRLSEGLIDFFLENQTDFMFLVDFQIKQPVNVKSPDGELEKQVQVLPLTSFSFMQLQVEGQFSYKFEYKYQKLKPEALVKEVQVTENLDLIITQEDLEQRILFELINKTERPIHFEIMIMELSGIRSESGRTVFATDVKPNSKAEICELTFDGAWSYKYSYTYRID
jgi:hypothetical protein